MEILRRAQEQRNSRPFFARFSDAALSLMNKLGIFPTTTQTNLFRMSPNRDNPNRQTYLQRRDYGHMVLLTGMSACMVRI